MSGKPSASLQFRAWPELVQRESEREVYGKRDGKVTAITETGGGIARVLVQAIAAQGASIVVNDLGVTLTGDREFAKLFGTPAK